MGLELEPSLKEIRQMKVCSRRDCRGCVATKKCNVCEERFCGDYKYEGGDWSYDEKLDEILCPICTAVWRRK